MRVFPHLARPSVARGITVVCAAVLVISARTARAGIDVWTSQGPGTVSITTLAIDPTTPTTLYAGACAVWVGCESTLFKSTDGGGSWNGASAGLPENTTVHALAIDPTTSGTLYAVARSNDSGIDRVFKSTDSGGTWGAADTGLDVQSVNALAIDPAASSTLYAGTNSGVSTSTDAGNTWRAASMGLPGAVRALVVDPTTPGTLYGASSNDGIDRVFKSSDSGKTWSAASTGLPEPTSVSVLAIDPTAPGTLYVGTDPQCGGGALMKNGGGGAVEFGCSTVDRVFKSTDGGGTWSAASPSQFGGVLALAIDPTGTLYVGTGGGVFKSTDGGESWSAADAGLTDASNVHTLALTLALDPTNPGTLYAGTENLYGISGGVFKSTNAGGIWSAAITGLPGSASVAALAVDPTASGALYAGEGIFFGISGGVFKSADEGGSWGAANTGLPENSTVQALAIDPLTPGTLYGAVSGYPFYGVYKSTDAGGTWRAASTGLPETPVHALALDAAAPGTLYAGTEDHRPVGGGIGGVFKSTDAGGTWHAANTGLPDMPGTRNVVALVIDPAAPGTLYAATSDNGLGGASGIFKSTDAGGTWGAFNSGLTKAAVVVLTVDPTTPGTLYAGTDGDGVFTSTDGAQTWSATGLTVVPVAGVPMETIHVTALALDPSPPGTLYAATSGGFFSVSGVFKSTDAGATWSPFNAGLNNRTVTALAIDPTRRGRLYAATDGGGVFDIEPPCVGDCRGTSSVAINDLVTLVNVALGAAQPSACPRGVPSSLDVDIALLVQAVSNALHGCASGQ